MKNEKIITLIGCGNMGQALLRGWLKSDLKAKYIIVEPGAPAPEFRKDKRVSHKKSVDKEISKSDVIVLAVKPQVMKDVCATLKPFVNKKSLILSIAAGRSIKSFETAFGKSQPIIRTMPNLAAAVGEGMTVAVANKNVGTAQKKLAQSLMQCVGKVEWLKHEKLVNAATALMGNGPAYVFYLVEMLEASAVKLGLDKNLAASMARQTVIGGGALLKARNDAAAILRKNVTSPGGTTEAALRVLMNGETQKQFDKTLAAGKKRGEELSG